MLVWSCVAGALCENGDAPTAISVQGSGPFAVSTYVVPNPVGYKAATVYYPSDVVLGGCTTFAGIVVMPGMRGDQSVLRWLGDQLASNGFVVMNLDTFGLRDSPDQRGTQVLAALLQLMVMSNTSGSPISGKVDGNRLGVIGHSAGGGAALVAARNSMVKAVIPLAPWHPTIKSFPDVVSPTLVLTCRGDTIVPSDTNGVSMYQSVKVEKAYAEMTADGHFCVASGSGDKELQSRLVTSWMKRWLDRDERYTQFLCSDDAARLSGLQSWQDSCPY